MRFLANPRALLSLIVIVGVLIVGMRLSDIWQVTTSGKLFAHKALAENKPADTKTPDIKPDDMQKPSPEPTTGAAASPNDDILDKSPAELDLLKQLAERRDELDKRDHELDTRETLIKVAEQRVDQKIQELTSLRQQIQTLLNTASEAQAAQVDNLVKIYETMKPKEAARIFETLDTPVLLGVIQRMKPAHTALIMAEMSPEKAKEITVDLTKTDQLPKLK